jgi:hypothetical protein
MFNEAMGLANDFASHGILKGAALQKMYEAQTLWDEYMAESASLFLEV